MAQPVVFEASDERLLECLARHTGVERAAVAPWVDHSGLKQRIAYVVPSGGGTSTTDVSDGQIDRWENLWSMLYRQEDAADPEFDIRGWNSSYTRKPLPAEQMRDWVDETVRTIEEFGAKSILEIGCGSGLLLYRLAPRCSHYMATDFSAAAVDRLQRQVRDRDLSHIVEVRHGPAHALEAIPTDFDLVVVNSVVQYFPSTRYLDDVMEQAIAHTRPGGRVFVGDVYHLSLREAMQTSIVLEQSAPGTPTELLRSRVLHRIAGQTELLVDPSYFAGLASRSPDVGGVQARPKFGAYENEMTSFRYDAVVDVGGPPPSAVEVQWHDWPGDGLDASSLQDLLQGGGGGGFGVSRIPNSRAEAWLHRWAELNGDGAGSVAGVSTADLRSWTAGTSYELHMSCLSAYPDGSLDAAWLPVSGAGGQPRFPQPPPQSGPCTNDPLWARATEGLVRELRKELREVLGAESLPTLVCVTQLPPALEAVPDSLETPA